MPGSLDLANYMTREVKDSGREPTTASFLDQYNL